VLGRLRYGEWFAGISALALFAFLFLDWFGGGSGWKTLGWCALALCVVAIVAGLALPVVFALYESPVLPVLAAVVATVTGIVAVLALIVQVIAQPGPDELVGVEAGGWLGLLAAGGVARGGYLSMNSEYLPGAPLADVEVRPAPPPTAA
jgi:hypothetical protein